MYSLTFCAVKNTISLMARDMEGLVKLTEELTFTSRMHLLDPMVPPVFYKDEVSRHLVGLKGCWFESRICQ
jgi:hypothetical protein